MPHPVVDAFDQLSVIKHGNCHSRFNNSAWIVKRLHDDQQIHMTEHGRVSGVRGSLCVGSEFAGR